ncbi:MULTISPECIES: SOS response-associated peptidase [Brevibacillus]|jgi:putative SOS response-associated peptidase YedK|uniref:SOS response-associated peptidase n=1 Tax=Brevibacillus TaxID=55080 RepID=UPI001FA9F913|nr:SOS response-associated peptidase [Brevibacillus borstelensis]MCM3591666.1 SOS response-associated peptidase [Brevibacillus borstelensis]MED1745098.1 SOS response-associated peptidase [Brevibacillus borstelensis]MED1873427.1 SOS response-associated peptidase [Brevibacillus borstelensis]
MCGRFTLVTDPEKLMSRFQLQEILFDLKPRYNIAPGQPIPAILADGGRQRLGQLRWGLVPSWAQDDRNSYKMINARAETLTERPAFRKLFVRKRCLIPADGFYEWRQTQKGKQSMRIMMKNEEPFAFAGLFDTWTNADGVKLHTCAIITTSANEVVAGIHDRMPVILKGPEEEAIWLDRDTCDSELLRSLLTPYDAAQMRAYPVSHIVGSPKNDVAECIQEIAEPAW